MLARVPPETKQFNVVLQRNAFGPRLVARAADVWRAMQDVVVDQSSDVGWTPERYAETNSMFIVRTMAVQHVRELKMGEAMVGRTWPSRARRDMLFTRQVRLFAGDSLVAAGSQEWALLSRDLQPKRAGRDLYDAFTIFPSEGEATVPTAPAKPRARVHQFTFSTWNTWMDPFGHVNHPVYVDFCDEATSRVISAAGLDAQQLEPIAEEVHFRAAIGAQANVTVETSSDGTDGRLVWLRHRILLGDKLAATATTVRALQGDESAAWAAAFDA